MPVKRITEIINKFDVECVILIYDTVIPRNIYQFAKESKLNVKISTYRHFKLPPGTSNENNCGYFLLSTYDKPLASDDLKVKNFVDEMKYKASLKSPNNTEAIFKDNSWFIEVYLL